VCSSDLGYPANKVLSNPLFVERNYGELEGLPWSYPVGDIERYDGVETMGTLQARVEAGLAYLRSLEGENVLLVGHGTFLVFLQQLLNPTTTITEAELPNAQIVQLL
jgi:broad specificity phosphatase PhoE